MLTFFLSGELTSGLMGARFMILIVQNVQPKSRRRFMTKVLYRSDIKNTFAKTIRRIRLQKEFKPLTDDEIAELITECCEEALKENLTHYKLQND